MSKVANELALNAIDDHADAENCLTQEELELIDSIQHNVETWEEELDEE